MNSSIRHTTSLDGDWQLTVLDAQGAATLEANVVVPGPWTTQVAGYGNSHASVRYIREFGFEPADASAGKRTFLRFGAVNYATKVQVNGAEVGGHTGAWTPFEFDVTDQLQSGANTVEVTVSYPPMYGTETERGYLEIPHGKQSWYGTTAGIWQSVALETRAAAHLSDVVVTPNPTDGTIAITAQIAGSVSQDLRFWAEVYDGQTVVATSEQVHSATTGGAGTQDGAHPVNMTVTVPAPQFWSLDAPYLYEVRVVLATHEVVDQVTRSTGFRTFETRDGMFLLNGKEIEIRAVLDQDYHPNSSSIPESTEALEDLFKQTRALGFNMLRVHIKRPDHRYYEIADRMGMLVWTELPNWLTWTPQVAREGVQLLEDLIRLDGHHPSIVTWTVMNESWGIDIKSAKQRDWLINTFEHVKTLVPHSLVVDNSACLPNFHLKTDIDDYHLYRGIPESRAEWDTKITEFAGRPDWSFSPYGDAQRTGSEPLMLSEFGNWGLPHALDQYSQDGSEPWWFAAGKDWAFGAAEGTNLMQRFEDLGLREVFGSWEQLVKALQRVQMIANRYQTGSIRMKPQLSGYVLTQLSDVQWEANGLFDANRNPKAFNSDFALINGDYCVVLRPDRYSATAEETLNVAVTVTRPRTTANTAKSADLRITCGGVQVATTAVSLTDFSEQSFDVPLPSTTQQVEVASELWDEGELVARDAADILVVEPAPAPQVTGYFMTEQIKVWLENLGLQTQKLKTADQETPPQNAVLVVNEFCDVAQSFARNGGKVLVLAEDEYALGNGLGFLPSANLGPRTGDGDWVPRNEWLDRSGPFATVPGDIILGIGFEDLLGDWVINGIPNAMRPAKVYSGIFSGWLRGTATTTATIAWSEGHVTFTTLKLRQQQGKTATANQLGIAMLNAAAN